VRARLVLPGARFVEGKATLDLGHLPGTRKRPGTEGADASRRRFHWVVQPAARGARAELVVVSEKGGTERRTLTLP
jgi:hypothetical protein